MILGLVTGDPKLHHARDHYQPLKSCLRRTHWNTNDIATLKNAIGSIKSNVGNRERDSKDMAERYISCWDARCKGVFAVPRSVEYLDPLQLKVRMDLGVETTAGDKLAVKLWLNRDPPNTRFRGVFEYLMRGLRPNQWPTDWVPAIWDVRRGNILQNFPVRDEIPMMVSGQAKLFQHYWDQFTDDAETTRRKRLEGMA